MIRRRMLKSDQAGAISGLSSINFDQIARARILDSLAKTSLDSMQSLKAAFTSLEQRLGRPPRLMDFARFAEVDPVVIAGKRGNYWTLKHAFHAEPGLPSPAEAALLNFLTTELLNGKRPHELLLLKQLLQEGTVAKAHYRELLKTKGCIDSEKTMTSVERVLSLEFFTAAEQKKYGKSAIVTFDGTSYELSAAHKALLSSARLKDHVDDIILTGLYLARHKYDGRGELQVGQLYSRKDVCRLLNWKNNEYSTLYGYKVDKESNSCPIFVTYHKADHVSESTQYGDEFLDSSTLKWFTRSNRTLQSSEVQAIVEGEIPLHVFVKKDDAEGVGFYYLGRAESRDAVQTTMAGSAGKELNVVTTHLDLMQPMDDGLYEYLAATAHVPS